MSHGGISFRSLGGKLRIGLAEQSVLVAIAHAAVHTPPGQGERTPEERVAPSHGSPTV